MAIERFEDGHLEQICSVLADTERGLTGREIGRLLAELGIDDPCPGITKRDRLSAALAARQRETRLGNCVGEFIQKAMDPARYTSDPNAFRWRRDGLNVVLAFSGISLGEDGKLVKVNRARTLSEAENRAQRLRSELSRRGVHPDVLRFCQAELLQDNYFHAVFEATKSVADKIRQKGGLTSDGSSLVDEAFTLGKSGISVLAINTLQSETEKSEHKGFANLLRGMFGMFRNVTAHAPKISWTITEQDAFDLLTVASMLHRHLDSAVPTGHR